MRPPPQPPRPVLPNPGRAENGKVACNEPLIVDGRPVGYCTAWVHPHGTRFRRPRWHKGPHRVEWWAEA